MAFLRVNGSFLQRILFYKEIANSRVCVWRSHKLSNSWMSNWTKVFDEKFKEEIESDRKEDGQNRNLKYKKSGFEDKQKSPSGIYQMKKDVMTDMKLQKPKGSSELTNRATFLKADEELEIDSKPLLIESAYNSLMLNPDLAKNWKQFGELFSQNKFLNARWPFVLLSFIANKEKRVSGLFEIGMSLAEFVKSFGDRHVVMRLVASISLCVHHGDESNRDQAFAFYDDLCLLTDVLDASSTLLLIRSFSKTSRWRKCLDFLEMTRISAVPTQPYYSPIIKAALIDGETELAENLLSEMHSVGIVPSDDVFECLIQLGMVQKLLEMFRNFHWIPSASVALVIQKHFLGLQPTENWSSEITKINHKSVCLTCAAKVDPLPRIPEADFHRLREVFLAKAVVKDGNVFLNSTPEEVAEFHEFLLRKKSGFDVIIDGLNVSHCTHQKASAKDRDFILSQVIEYFVKDKKRVLVLGRKHLKGSKSVKTPRSKSDGQVEWFFASNISADDPFMLYAALHSGQDSLFVTNDELRDHRYLLGSELADLLKLWQRGHQVLFLGVRKRIGKMKPEFQWPDNHDTRVQMSSEGNVWHIPFDDGSDRKSFQLPNSWLCLRRTSK